ncbi:MAG: molybdopterin-dependent oxidoreductase [Gammaproteobacteria bacterium]|jgi:assimilatory nitrate reductase catalytic subunit
MKGTTTRTTCPYCGVGCGIEVTRQPDGSIQLRGDRAHPANLGRLCCKGSALDETLSLEGRLLYPSVAGRRVGWDQALDTVAGRFADIIDRHGPDAVAFYVSGQLLTEDYYVANKLMKGFIGSANIDTNSRLCMASSVAAHKRALGSDTVPGCYEDWEKADLLVLAGSNTAWCHPVLYQRACAAKKARPQMKVVVIDPRRTATCDVADLHLAIQPGTDAHLFTGLLGWLHRQGHGEGGFVDAHTEGLDEALRLARWYAPSLQSVAECCGLAARDVETFFGWFARTERTLTVYSQGINQSSSGTDKVNAIINCHLLTGRIGRPGMGPFSVTGQPNAMGGREVGALANQLAAHMALDDPEHRGRVARFWKATRMARAPGLKAVDLFQAVERGEVKALWIMATNPVVSMPDATRVRRALTDCELLVVSDCVAQTDTSAYADVLLPALTWGEKDGSVTNSERCISRQRAFLEAPGEARPDWWIISAVARRLGFSGFDYQTAHEIFVEHARLSAFENAGDRDFDLSGLVGLSASEYDTLAPVQWPVRSSQTAGRARLFGDGRFSMPGGRARFVAVAPRPPAVATSFDYPLVLNTGRVRDQWHTMTRTGKSPRLSGHVVEPYAELHPADAQAVGVTDGQLVQLVSRRGEALLRARVSDAQRRGSVFVPMHWNNQFASAAVVDALVSAFPDPHSGQPEFKHTPVRVVAYRPVWYGFVLSRHRVDIGDACYWVRSRRRGLWHYELAGETLASDWARQARRMLQADVDGAQWSEMFDSAQRSYRGARLVAGRLDGCVFIGPDHRLPPRDWLIGLFGRDRVDGRDRMRVLAGTPEAGREDGGRTVCSCFGVGRNTLCRAVRELGLKSAEEIGQRLHAGTNCGSCVPELRALLAELTAAI